LIDETSEETLFVITGSIARSATCQYLIYSEADFEVFRPAGPTPCTVWGEIWRGPSSMPNFTPIGATTGVGPQKLKFLLRFNQNVE